MDSLSKLSNPEPGKWNKPEKYTGMIFLAALVALFIYLWSSILPFLIKVTQNTLYLVFLLGILGVVIFLLTDARIRTGVFFLVRMILRAFASAIVKIDPIAVMKIYIEDLKDKREEMYKKITVLQAQKEKLDSRIVENKETIKAKMDEALYAKNKGRPLEEISITMETVGDLKEFNDKLTPLQINVTKAVEFMDRVYKSSGYLVKKMEEKVKIKQAEYELVKASSNALKSALSVFKGDPDKKYMFELSVDQIQNEMVQRLSEMKRAMDYSTEFVDSVDIQKGVASEKGLKMLEEYAKSGSINGLLSESAPPTPRIQPDNQTSGAYNSLLD